MVPGDRHPVRIETGGHPVEEVGPVHVVLDVFLAGPDDLHRAVDLLGDLDRAHDAVDLEPPPEAAAEQMIVHHDLLQRQPGGLRRGGLGTAQDLGADPDLAAVLAHVRPCSSSAPSPHARETAPGRSPRPWSRRPPWPSRRRRSRRATAPAPCDALSSSRDDVRGAEGRVRALVPFDLERRRGPSSPPPYGRRRQPPHRRGAPPDARP